MSKRFRIAFSFSGDKREFVAEIADILAGQFGADRVLYDKYHEAEFARPDLAFHLPALYHDETDLVVAVLSNDYENKEWCGLEWNALYGLIMKRKADEVVLCRFDRVEGQGLYGLAGFIDLDDKTPAEVATLITERLAISEGYPKDYYTRPTATPVEKGFTGFRQITNSSNRGVSRYDFFIAYATPDRRQAQDLCWFLQDDSCEVFLDVKDVRPGTLWMPALREALGASRAIVVLVSTYTHDAFYQQEEIVRAIQFARDKPRAHTVIPVILEKLPHGAESMPYGLSSWQALDATRSGGLKRVAAELVAWLNDHQLDAK
jgi:hypothetical protein